MGFFANIFEVSRGLWRAGASRPWLSNTTAREGLLLHGWDARHTCGTMGRVLVIAVGLMVCVGRASAQTTQPSDEIHRPLVAGGEAGATTGHTALFETGRVVVALGGVIGLILVMKVGATKVLGIRGVGVGAGRGVRVVSRTVLGPKQQLVLLEVGRKLVLISDSAGKIATVTEIVDPDEVAELAAQAGGKTTQTDFNRELHGRGAVYEEEEMAGQMLEGEPANAELSQLQDRIRSMGRQLEGGRR